MENKLSDESGFGGLGQRRIICAKFKLPENSLIQYCDLESVTSLCPLLHEIVNLSLEDNVFKCVQ